MAEFEQKVDPNAGGVVLDVHSNHKDKDGNTKKLSWVRSEMSEDGTTCYTDVIQGTGQSKPRNISIKQWDENYERIFGKK